MWVTNMGRGGDMLTDDQEAQINTDCDKCRQDGRNYARVNTSERGCGRVNPRASDWQAGAVEPRRELAHGVLRVTEQNQAQYWGGLMGVPLGSQEVAKARKLEMEYIRQMQVYLKVPVQRARDG